MLKRARKLDPKNNHHDDRDLKILRLWSVDGLTSQEIADRTGATRSAVMGTVRRIRLQDMDHDDPNVCWAYEKGKALARAERP